MRLTLLAFFSQRRGSPSPIFPASSYARLDTRDFPAIYESAARRSICRQLSDITRKMVSVATGFPVFISLAHRFGRETPPTLVTPEP